MEVKEHRHNENMVPEITRMEHKQKNMRMWSACRVHGCRREVGTRVVSVHQSMWLYTYFRASSSWVSGAVTWGRMSLFVVVCWLQGLGPSHRWRVLYLLGSTRASLLPGLYPCQHGRSVIQHPFGIKSYFHLSAQ